MTPWDISARAALKWTAEFSMDAIVWLLLRMVYHISVEIALFLSAMLVLQKIRCHSTRFCHEVRCDTTVPTFSAPMVCLSGWVPSASCDCEATLLLSCPPSPGLGNAACMGNSIRNDARMGQFLRHLENFALPEDPVLDSPTHWHPFSPCPFQAVFPILHPKPNVNTKDCTSMYFGVFHFISVDFLFEAVTVLQPYWSVFIAQRGGHKTVCDM